MPLMPSQNIGRKVTLKPMAIHQKWSLPRRSSYIRPVILGNQ